MEPFMLRRILKSALATAFLLISVPEARADDDSRFAADFVQGLRERGFYDVAMQYLDQLRLDPETPADLKKTIEYEEGRTLIQEATHANDPDVKKSKLEQAKLKIEAFVKANPDLPQTSEALVELAHLLFERGNSESDYALEARSANDKEAKLAGARGYYDSARSAYTKVFDQLGAKLAKFSKLPDDPRKIEREALRNTVMRVELQKTIVDYYEAQTYPQPSKQRSELLDKALVDFEATYKKYRLQMAGLTARMWQGKCFEEQGKLGEASGIFKELIDHPGADPNLRMLQKQVEYFQIIVEGKRKGYALAADECYNWLRKNPKDRRTYEALGVQFELAKNLIAQLPELDPANREKAIKQATDYLTDVVRVVSPFKPEAIVLLQKYRPNAALKAADVSKLNYDDAVAQAGQAISTLAYDNAITLLQHAIRKVGPTQNPAKANSARYMLAYCELMTKRYYEAAVVAEHVARRYPRDEWAAKSADLGMQAIVDAYNNFTHGNRTSDLDRLFELARYTAETWPETEQGDSGRMTVGLVSLGRGHYPEAITAFESVRPSSSKFVDSQTSCGDAHWKQSLLLREKGKAKEADVEVEKAVAQLKKSLKDRRDANAPDSDLGVVSNACDLAVIELEIDKPADALALLEPIGKKLSTMTDRSPSLNTAYSRVLAYILRGHVATGKVELAIADMKTLESIGGAGNSAAQLYYELGRLLEKEMESLKKRNDEAGLKRTEESYRKFLKALVASKTGQTFQSLRWAADNLLKLGSAKEANEVYTTLVETFGKDPAFLKTPNAPEQITLIRLKQVAALRTMTSLSEAETLLNELVEQNPRSIEPQMEKGFLLNAKAEAKQGKWADTYGHWKGLALKLGKNSPKPIQYYEAWYQAAEALVQQGQKDVARSTLASVLRLSPPPLDSPEMKAMRAKYELLLKKLAK
jgi:cellulose synthase operon protein C